MSKCDRKSVVVVGAGGHAKVVISTLQAAGYTVTAAFDDDPAKRGQLLLGVPVKGATSELPDTYDVEAIVAIGSNPLRQQMALRFGQAVWVTVVHPAAYVHPSVKIGPGTVVFAGAVIQPGSVVGAHVIVNTGATIDHDCVVGEYVHLAPGVRLAGDVEVGQGAFVGIGSVVVPGIRIGEWATVGAGGVVVSDLPDGVTAVGIPAKPMK
jgi:sugar O-acyltransferase (sialic acid O-acetyltransferase NeuD family)